MEPPAKKVRYEQKWKDEYALKFKHIVKSEKPGFAFCELCKDHVSIRCGGSNDLKRHSLTRKHKDAQNAVGSSSLISFVKKNADDDLSSINAEVRMTKFLVERNLPLSTSDDIGDLLRAMYPKSEEIRKYKCARTKATAIVHALAAHEKDLTVKNMKQCSVFSLSTDGGNDVKEKLFPVIVRYCDLEREKVVTEVLSVDSLKTTTATASDIFSHIKEVVDDKGLDLKNCISFSVDNASVMVGEKSGVAAHLHSYNEHISIIGCPCHRINLAASKAANTLPYKLDQLLIDVYFFLDKSSKRMARLRELQEILGAETHVILKHASTRWLSLGPCITRLLEQWEPLSALFLEISEDTGSRTSQIKAKSVLKKLLSTEVKAYALFIQNVIPTFERANATLQADAPLIHKVRAIMMSIIKDLCLRFITPSSLKDCDLMSLDVHDKSKVLSPAEIDLGSKCKKYVDKEMKGEEKNNFYKSVVQYFQTAVHYLQKRCNLDNAALVNAAVADPQNRSTSSLFAIMFFINHFPSLLPSHEETDSDEMIDSLTREFRMWQASEFAVEEAESVDRYWFRMAKVESQCGGKSFALLSRCMLGIVSIFHSNAMCERLFSLVRRNRTEFRHSMSNKLVEPLSICKTKWGSKSFMEPVSKDVLMKAKSATVASLAKS